MEPFLEEVGKALRDFVMLDLATSNLYHMTYAHMLVEINISKGLPKIILVDSPLSSLNINS